MANWKATWGPAPTKPWCLSHHVARPSIAAPVQWMREYFWKIPGQLLSQYLQIFLGCEGKREEGEGEGRCEELGERWGRRKRTTLSSLLFDVGRMEVDQRLRARVTRSWTSRKKGGGAGKGVQTWFKAPLWEHDSSRMSPGLSLSLSLACAT